MTSMRDEIEGGPGESTTLGTGAAEPAGAGRPPTSTRPTPPRGWVRKVVAAAQPRPRTHPPVSDEPAPPATGTPPEGMPALKR
jgi:hypothetical protein